MSLQPELDLQHSTITIILFQNPFHPWQLKTELTKNPLHHAGKNGEHCWGENLYSGGENGEHSSGEIFQQYEEAHQVTSHMAMF